MAKSPQELYEERKRLYDEQYAAQQAASTQAAEKARKDLATQMATQRNAYVTGVQAAQESGMSRGRNMLNQLAGRGLGTSGLMQLGDVQGRLATGKALSSLATANRQVQEAGMDAAAGIESNLAGQQRQAGLDLKTGLLANEESLYGREQDALTEKRNAAIALLEAGANGNMSEAQLAAYKAIMGAGTEEELAGITVPTAEDYFLAGDMSFKDKETWARLAGSSIAPSAFFADLFGGNVSGITFKDAAGNNQNFKNWDDAAAYVKQQYATKPLVVNGTISVKKRGDAVKFVVNGKYYSTYNEAEAAAKGTSK